MFSSDKKMRLLRVKKFTLIEVLAAMAVFVILISVMMQFFTSARNLWLSSNRRTELYANANIALDMITRDLQSAMYNNDNNNQGIYPFWFRSYTQGADTVKELNFITATDLKSIAAKSNICEVSYTYVKNSGNWVKDSDGNVPNGWLVRRCEGDNGANYDFMNYSFEAAGASAAASASRLTDIWETGNIYKRVIPGVISLDFTCYEDSTTPITAIDDSSINRYGTPFPQIIKIKLVLLDPDSWNKYYKIVAKDPLAAAQLKRSNSRTFTRTVYLGNRTRL